MYIANYSRRTKAAFLLFFIFFALCAARLLYIQFFRSEYLSSIARKQHYVPVDLEPRRGTIYDSGLKPQAVNLPCDSLFAAPNNLNEKEKEELTAKLAPVLNCDRSYLKNRLSKKKAFVWLGRKISSEQSEALKKLNLKTVGTIKESKRCYPNGYLACQAIGFAGMDNNGLEGMELYYEKYLKGQPGMAIMLRDARSKKLDIYQNMAAPQDGFDLVLTIDEVIQYIAERELDKAYQTYHAKGASIVVLNPRTGEILAIANRPGFDMNKHSNVSKDQIRNRAVCDLFEPGSVFKIVTASAAIEEKVVSEHDRFFCENGEYKIASRILHDHKSHGWLTFQEVIEQSSNIGTCKVAQKVGPANLHRYIKLFGFGAKSGVDMPGEVSGIVRDLKLWQKGSIAAVPMGQEVAVTALQLVSAISVIANGGLLMKPYIVKEIRDKQGELIKSYSPVTVRRVISEQTAARVKKILIGVIENGTGTLAKTPDFTAGGKTGTAQKLEANGTYSHNKFMATFIGFAPAEDPAIAVVVTVDEPHGSYFGGVVSAPVFKNLVNDVLRYLRNQETSSEIVVLNESNSGY